MEGRKERCTSGLDGWIEEERKEGRKEGKENELEGGRESEREGRRGGKKRVERREGEEERKRSFFSPFDQSDDLKLLILGEE